MFSAGQLTALFLHFGLEKQFWMHSFTMPAFLASLHKWLKGQWGPEKFIFFLLPQEPSRNRIKPYCFYRKQEQQTEMTRFPRSFYSFYIPTWEVSIYTDHWKVQKVHFPQCGFHLDLLVFNVETSCCGRDKVICPSLHSRPVTKPQKVLYRGAHSPHISHNV